MADDIAREAKKVSLPLAGRRESVAKIVMGIKSVYWKYA